MKSSDWDSRLKQVLSQRENYEPEKVRVFIHENEMGLYIKKYIDSTQLTNGHAVCEIIYVNRVHELPEGLQGCPAVEVASGIFLYEFKAAFKIKELLDPMRVISSEEAEIIEMTSVNNGDDEIKILETIFNN